MDNYIIDEIDLNAINRILDIYNSNKSFLCNHLGVSSVSKEFILNEIEEMKKIGFNSSIMCDFKISHEVYLSLLMIDYRLKGNGLGKTIYNQLEKMFKSNNVQSIRIDVVYDYEENALEFWKKQGFVPNEKIELEWNGYKSNAIKMHKII